MQQEIIGHHQQKKILERFITIPSRHHAFLFSGPEHVGKRLMAQEFARQLANGVVDHWNMSAHVSGDITVVAALTEKKKNRQTVKDISVEQIADARRLFSLAADKKAKTLLIDDAHRMTITAQNSLLKTLEEPSRNGFIILITHDHDRLLDTIKSRCVHIRFTTLGIREISRMSSDEMIVQNAQGRPGYVALLESDADFASCVTMARDTLRSVIRTPVHERLQLAAELSKKDDWYLKVFFNVWVYRVWSVAHETKKWNLIKAAGKIEDTVRKFESTNVNKQLLIEDLLVNIA